MEVFIGLLFMFVLVVIIWVMFQISIAEQKRYNEMMEKLKNSTLAMTPNEFEEMRKQTLGQNRRMKDFAGIYILHNQTNGQYYVGQSTTVFDRVNQHFKGRGNGDVYHHYRSGHNWSIRLLDLRKTNFNSLNELERHFINYHDAFHNGYNRTRGNNG